MGLRIVSRLFGLIGLLITIYDVGKLLWDILPKDRYGNVKYEAIIPKLLNNIVFREEIRAAEAFFKTRGDYVISQLIEHQLEMQDIAISLEADELRLKELRCGDGYR